MTPTLSSSDTIQRTRDFWPADKALRIAALMLFQSSGYTPLRRLRCEVKDAVVIVHGVLPSYYLKQMAQTILQRLDGIESVLNLVEVRETDSCHCWESEDEAPEVGPFHF